MRKPALYHMWTTKAQISCLLLSVTSILRNSKTLATFGSWAGQFEYNLVKNSKMGCFMTRLIKKLPNPSSWFQLAHFCKLCADSLDSVVFLYIHHLYCFFVYSELWFSFITFEPCHEILVLFILLKLIFQMPMRIHPVRLHVLCLVSIRLLPYLVCANSEGSGETAQMRRLAWAFAGCLCDKYHSLTNWLISCCLLSFCSCFFCD